MTQPFNAFVAGLPAAGALTGTEQLSGVQGAGSVGITPAQIKTYALPGGGPSTVIAPSGNAATDTAAFTALLATPGVIQLKAGTYLLNNALTFTASVIIRGAGSADGGMPSGTANSTGLNAATTLLFGTTASSTISGITLQGVGSLIEDVHVQSASTTLATTGNGITLNGANGGQVNRCSTYGFWVGIKALDTYAYSFTCNKVFGPANIGFLQNNQAHPDQGDTIWMGNWISKPNFFSQ